ncbi:MAG: cytochrome c3 family protein [Thermodesulfobacteriota bacterium]|jgi:predicted CXXCH cytochrome family protein|nr:cytochrome c3 family protein [Thermodesulfobacteriota bacterium]
MRKFFLFLAVLFLGVGPAAASIVGTKHDMSTSDAGNDKVCVYCHTPHGADTTVVKAPLWNRSTQDAAGSVYTGLSLEASTVTDMTLANINATDTPLCLSCHDGSVGEVLQNEPNSGNTDVTGYVFGSAAANLTTDMSNDHPIGFTYDSAAATDDEINDSTVVEAVGALGAGAVSYGATSDQMWCSSCHDVHDNTNAPFLRISNAASALCTTCHIK